ncbi:MAG: carboxypeptidase-like regulatory domain-containing protein, partial [Acidobacteriota bacterium]|nr:carboxypeptidase-like regulatory domain-containing protein [Acidobacteriota bacterium]
MSRITFIFVALVACILSSTILPVLAQETSASITGKIIDPSGAPISNATVKATDEQRGTIWPTNTNADGIFVFPRIPVGTYEIRVEAAGFKTAVRPHIGLELNARDRIDVQMEIGAVTENVTVAADSAILQTDTTQVGEVLNPTTIINTPL